MKRLWSPWRMPYIEGRNHEVGCILCNRQAEEDGLENLILHRGDHAYVMLNLYPYSNGHMMVVPFAHQPSLDDLDDATQAELIKLTSRAISMLRQAYGAEAFNVGINIGEPAGAGVPDHVHVHVVPRWSGDTNFMATTAETRVIPEALEQTYERLRAAWRGSSKDA